MIYVHCRTRKVNENRTELMNMSRDMKQKYRTVEEDDDTEMMTTETTMGGLMVSPRQPC